MKLDTGTIIVIVIIAIFYIRIMVLRQQKIRASQQQAAAQKSKKGKKNVSALQPDNEFYNPRYQVRSWWLVTLAVILLLAAVAINNAVMFPGFIPSNYQEYWWIPGALGGIIFIFCIK